MGGESLSSQRWSGQYYWCSTFIPSKFLKTPLWNKLSSHISSYIKLLSTPNNKKICLLPSLGGPWKTVVMSPPWSPPVSIYLVLSGLLLFVKSLIVSNSLWPHGLQPARLPCPSPSPRVCSNSCPSSQWCHPTISSSVVAFSAFNLSQHQGLFQWVSSSHQVAKVLEFQLQCQSFQWVFRVDCL